MGIALAACYQGPMIHTGGAWPFLVCASGFSVFGVTGVLGEVLGRWVPCCSRGFSLPTDAFGAGKAVGWRQ